MLSVRISSYDTPGKFREHERKKSIKQPTTINLNQISDSFFIYVIDSCDSKNVHDRVECGWSNITKEQCLARDCCHDNSAVDNRIKCFVKPYLGKYTLCLP